MVRFDDISFVVKDYIYLRAVYVGGEFRLCMVVVEFFLSLE